MFFWRVNVCLQLYFWGVLVFTEGKNQCFRSSKHCTSCVLFLDLVSSASIEVMMCIFSYMVYYCFKKINKNACCSTSISIVCCLTPHSRFFLFCRDITSFKVNCHIFLPVHGAYNRSKWGFLWCQNPSWQGTFVFKAIHEGYSLTIFL